MKTSRERKCPNLSNHEHGPESYVEWSEWAEKKSQTHDQKRCWGCNMMVIWVKKGSDEDELQKILESK